MYDEEGRKINLGQRIGMPLDSMSIADMEGYIANLKTEIARVETAIEKQKSHNAAAEALFK